MKKLSSGVEGLDMLIQGGYPDGRVLIVSGSPGAGKTTLSIQFLIDGANRGEKGMYVSTLDSPSVIIENMGNYEFHLNQYIKDKAILFMDMGPNIEAFQGSATSIVPTGQFVINKISEYVKKAGIKRLVIDSTSVIKYGASGKISESRELSKFVRYLKSMGCTVLLISELMSPDSYCIEHYLASGVIFMHNFLLQGSMVRGIQIIKMAGTEHDCDIHRINFKPKGIVVSKDKVLGNV